MTATHASPIINGYLARLEAEAADLPWTERRELIDGVREHIVEARTDMPEESDADLLVILSPILTGVYMGIRLRRGARPLASEVLV